MKQGVRLLGAAGVMTLLVVSGACAGSDRGGDRSTSTVATTSTTLPRPVGPTATLTPLTGPGQPFIAATNTDGLAAKGYVQEEFVATGTAQSYRQVGERSADGRWSFEPTGAAEYRTRVLVRRPVDPAKSSGIAIVEWLNVSGGLDADAEYSAMQEEILRQGHVWIGVSAQRIGVEGGPVLVQVVGGEGVAGKGLKAIDPARYGTLMHPGDGFSFDLFTQVARAVRSGAAIGAVHPDRVLAAGQSQSAIALTTYYNGVQPLTDAFDGFFVHSRASVALPLVEPGQAADLAGAIATGPVLLRTDLGAPVMDLQTEGDLVGVLNSVTVRQDDSPKFRLWEVAGAAHADRHLLGALADSVGCGTVNNGPTHVVVKAALRALVDWVKDGRAPVEAPRLETTNDPKPALVRDDLGIVKGGVRTPSVDVPSNVLVGTPGPNPALICLLLGQTTPLPPGKAVAKYGSADAYSAQYNAATDATIKAGFALEEDREALLAFADRAAVA